MQYPPGWAAVAALINADPRPVAVLPADSMRQFAWAGDAPVLDPLPRWVRADVLATGDLTISGRRCPARASAPATCSGCCWPAPTRQLARAGVGWVVVESDWATGYSPSTLPLPVVYRDEDLTLYRVGGDLPAAPGRGIVLAAHWVWLGLLILSGVLAVVPRRLPGLGFALCLQTSCCNAANMQAWWPSLFATFPTTCVTSSQFVPRVPVSHYRNTSAAS